MNGHDKDNIPMLREDIELQKYRSRSLRNTMHEANEENSVLPPGALHGYRPTELMSSHLPGDYVLDSSQLMQRVQSRRPQVITPEESSTINWPSVQLGMSGHLLKSGPLGRCSKPDCTDCPSDYMISERKGSASTPPDSKVDNILYGDADGWAKRLTAWFSSHFPIMKPHDKGVQRWNQFFVIACLVAIFIDPLFFFLFSTEQDSKCIIFNWSLATVLAVVRSATDTIYLLHMLLQFRLAYVAPETRVVGFGVFVDDPKKVAIHYLRGKFFFDLFVVLPLPQVMILGVIPKYVGLSAANYAKTLLRTAVLLQYIPRIIRFVPLLGGESSNGFIFESAWANFVINILMFVLAGHVVGSCWYLFGLQRLNECLHDACDVLYHEVQNPPCRSFLDCGRGYDLQSSSDQNRIYKSQWLNDNVSTDCFNFNGGHFSYGIYVQSVLLTTEKSVVKKYIYSLFWGFQQISTLAGNLVPSYFEWEVLFTMGIIGLGLLLFALLIGNMQNFLQSLGRRRLEMQLRRRDVERWMSYRRLPDELRRRVRQAERAHWAATRGVDEDEMLADLPEDIQREIRLHFFKSLNKIRIFAVMEEPILNAISERLRQNFYINKSVIFSQGEPLEKMIFIVRGELESKGADGSVATLREGDVCGGELLAGYLEHTSMSTGEKVKFRGVHFFATRTVRCLTDVEAFVLRAADIEKVTGLYMRYLRKPRLQRAIRYESPYWKNMAATRIQVAWRYRMRRLRRSSPGMVNRTAGSSSLTRRSV